MTTLLRSVLIGALGLCAALLVACGDSNGLLPSDRGGDLGAKLDAVSSAVDAGKCRQARSAGAELTRKISSLPASVDPKLKRALSDGARTVQRRARSDCRPASTSTPSTSTTAPSTSTPSASTPPPTTSPSTPSTPSTTSSTPTTPRSTPKPPPSTPTTPPKTQSSPGNGGAGTGGSTGGGATGPGK